jgi:hypothetical protein
MLPTIAALIIAVVSNAATKNLSFAEEGNQPQQPGAKERLNQVLNAEGGTTVYMDPSGNVHTTTVLPNGERSVIVQPPQSPAINLGPPLQLNNRRLELPSPPPTPTHPPAPDFPQKAR